ncbi:MAG TPA: AI-2E family transporter [Bacillales bacterium]|nr:AI-2E family transporter [Bacillales bacterium]
MKKVPSVEWLIRLTIILLLFLCCYLFLKLSPLWRPVLDIVFTVLTPFLIAALFTYLLHPIVEALHRRNWPRPLAILLIYVIFFGGLGIGLVKGVPYMIVQLKTLGDQIPEFVKMYRHWIHQFYMHTSDLPETVHDRFRDVLRSVELYMNRTIENIIGILKGLAKSLLTILVIPVLVFYFLNDLPSIKRAVAAFVPKRWHRRGKQLLDDIDQSLGNYIRGQFFVCLFLGLMAAVGLWLLGLPYYVLLGIIIGITDIIPYFGPILGAVPAALVAATLSWELVVYVLVLIFILHFVEGNLLSPLIVGKSLHMHPALIIFVLFLGGEVGGLLGLLLAVPVFVVARVVFLHWRHSQKIDKAESLDYNDE